MESYRRIRMLLGGVQYINRQQLRAWRPNCKVTDHICVSQQCNFLVQTWDSHIPSFHSIFSWVSVSVIHRHTPPCVALVPCFLSKKIHPEDNYFKANREHWKPNILLRSAGFLYITGGSYMEAKTHGKWTELLHPVERQGPKYPFELSRPAFL